MLHDLCSEVWAGVQCAIFAGLIVRYWSWNAIVLVHLRCQTLHLLLLHPRRGALSERRDDFLFLTEQSKRSSWGHDLVFFHLSDGILRAMKEMQLRCSWLRRASWTTSRILPRANHQSFYRFRKRLPSASHDSHDYADKQNAMDGSGPVSLDVFLHLTMENTATFMSQSVTVLQQHLKAMHIFSYVTNDRRRLLQRRNKKRLKRALKK